VVTVLAASGAMLFYEVSPGDPPYRMVDELVGDDDGKQLRVHGWEGGPTASTATFVPRGTPRATRSQRR
jgi:hypothetical protein